MKVVEKKVTVFFLLTSLILVSAIQVSFAAPPVADWWGRLNLSGIMQNTTVVVEAFYTANNSHAANSTLGLVDSGYYRIVAPCNPNENLTFRVYGINVSLTYLCTQGSTTEFNLSVNTIANGGACQCYTGKDCSGTSYTSSGCTGGYCNSGTCASSAPATTTTTTTTTTGGGGGSTVTTVASVEVTKTVTTASPAAPAVVAIESAKAADLKVDEVTVSVKEAVSNVQVTVKESSLPSGANVAISAGTGSTYKYLEITTNVASTKIEKAKIKFKVEKTWTTSNSIDPNSIAMNRYASSKWDKLPTTKASEDAKYYYYEAESPGFSTFAVTGEKITAAACGNNKKEGTEECDGSDLAGQTCVSKGYTSGSLSCSSCKFNATGCVSSQPTTSVPTAAAACGNNAREGSEECDGSDLAEQSCRTKGFDSGTLSCSSCRFDTGKCIKPTTAKPEDNSWAYLLIAGIIIVISLIVYIKNIKKPALHVK